MAPTGQPITIVTTTDSPTAYPTDTPSSVPTNFPTEAPSVVPTEYPTDAPSEVPTSSPTSPPTDLCVDHCPEDCVPADDPRAGDILAASPEYCGSVFAFDPDNGSCFDYGPTKGWVIGPIEPGSSKVYEMRSGGEAGCDTESTEREGAGQIFISYGEDSFADCYLKAELVAWNGYRNTETSLDISATGLTDTVPQPHAFTSPHMEVDSEKLDGWCFRENVIHKNENNQVFVTVYAKACRTERQHITESGCACVCPTASPSAAVTEPPTSSPTGSPTSSPTGSPTGSPTNPPKAPPKPKVLPQKCAGYAASWWGDPHMVRSEHVSPQFFCFVQPPVKTS